MKAATYALTMLSLSTGCSKSDASRCEDGRIEPDSGCMSSDDTDADADADADADTDTDTDTDTGEPPGIDADADGVTVAAGDCDDTDPALGAQSEDYDCDGLSDFDESLWGTDLTHPDTDGDWVMDGDDVLRGRSPHEPEPLLLGLVEGSTVRIHLATTPHHRPVSLIPLMLTANGGEATTGALTTDWGNLVDHLETSWPEYDWAYGHARYSDYRYGSMGFSYDRPFSLIAPISIDPTPALNGLVEHSATGGADAPNSIMEALYQTLSGAGYDQACDGIFDPETDVLPFVADLSDPFAGLEGGGDDAHEDTLGVLGGMGFRPGERPFVVVNHENSIRDPDAGSETPGGCPGDASSSQVAEMTHAVGATIIAFDQNYWGGTGSLELLTDLAETTGSIGDLDGDPSTLEPLVFEYSASGLKWDIINSIAASIEHRPVEGIALPGTPIDFMINNDINGFVTEVVATEVSGLTGSADRPIDRFVLTAAGTVSSTTEEQTFDGISIELRGPADEKLGRLPIAVQVPVAE